MRRSATSSAWYLAHHPQLRRSAHRSVVALEADIRVWINEWNKKPKPFVWTKTADQILDTLAHG